MESVNLGLQVGSGVIGFGLHGFQRRGIVLEVQASPVFWSPFRFRALFPCCLDCEQGQLSRNWVVNAQNLKIACYIMEDR